MRKIYLAILSLLSFFFWSTKSTAQVSLYAFSQSNGTYTEISGGTLLGSTTSDDQYFVNPAVPLGGTTTTGVGFPIGFNFTYNGTIFDQFAVNNNGWISLGQSSLTPSTSLVTTSAYTPLSSTAVNSPAILRNRIAGIGRDLQAQAASELRFQTIGSAPNRQLIVQYKNYKRFGAAGTGDNFNFQIVLTETTNAIQVIFGTMVFNTTTTTSTIDHIGLGGTLSTDFNNRQTVAPHDWNATTAGTTNAQGCQNATTTITVTPPVSGLTFTWALPPCVAPPGGGTTSGPAGTVCPGIVNLTVTGASFGNGLTYQWEFSSDNVSWNNVTTGGTNADLAATVATNTYFRRKITCSGIDAWSSSLLVSVSPPVSVFPWTENFDGLATVGATSFPSCWTKQNGDWRSANNASTGFDADARSAPNFIQDAWSATNEFIWTLGFQLTAGTSYDFSFWFADYTPGYNSWAAEVWYNSAPNSTGATQLGTPFLSVGTTAPIVYTQVKRAFIPSTSGVYYFAIRVNEATANPWYLSFDDFSLGLTPPCVEPSGLTVSALTTTSVTLSWTASPSAPTGGYQWEVRTSGAAGSGATGLAASGVTGAGITTANVTGLSANTAYTYYVRSDCGGGSFSPWTVGFAFRTLCDPIITFPYTETFEAVSPTRSCWKVDDYVVGTVNWIYAAGAFGGNVTVAHGGTLNARFYQGNYNGNTTRLVSPELNLSSMTNGANVRFWFAQQNWVGDQDELRVYYKTSAAGPWTLIPGAIYTTSVDQWTEVELTLPSSTGAPVYYVAFEGYASFGWGVVIDDVTIEPTPTCPKPTAVTALGILPTAVLVSFTPPVTGPTVGYIVEYGAPGFTPGTAGTAGVGGTLFLGGGSPITVTPLTPNTTYDFYLRRICISNVDYSVNVKITATTLCAAVNVPYLEDFDGATPPAIPTCTSIQDLNGAPTWATINMTPVLAWGFEGNALRYLYSVTNPANDWFFTRGMNLTAGTMYEVRFKYGATDPLYPERMKVAFGTSATSTAMVNTIADFPNIIAISGPPFANRVRVSFTATTTGINYLGFQAYSLADEFQLFLDSIFVKAVPPVDVGVTGITLPALNCPTSGVVLQATIRNHNIIPVNFATYPVTVTANITGAATGAPSFVINTGTLAPGATMNVNLSPAFNFTTAGLYNISVATSSPSDPETANDTLKTSFFVNPNPATPVITPAGPQICIGTPIQLNTQFVASPAPVTLPAVSSGTIAVAIPDNAPAGASHSLTVAGVPAGAFVTNISVTLNMTHTWISDMIINLKAPNGNVLNLFNQRGDDGDNLLNTVITSVSGGEYLSQGIAPFTGTYAPDVNANNPPSAFPQSVTAFTGLYSVGNGTWTLALRDNAGLDFGTLTSWSIVITYQLITPTITWTPVTSLFTNAAATTAYLAGSNASSVYANPGATATYTVTATSLAGCTSSANTTVTVNPYPVITAGSIPDTVCISDQLIPLVASPVGGSWSGTGVSGTNFVPPATAVGTYTLTYTYANAGGCVSTVTKRIAVKDCPERMRLLRDNAVILYPNPNTGKFNIRINSVLYNNLGMRVYNNTGMLVRTQQFSGLSWGRVVPIDLTNLAGGVYTVEFYYQGGPKNLSKNI